MIKKKYFFWVNILHFCVVCYFLCFSFLHSALILFPISLYTIHIWAMIRNDLKKISVFQILKIK